MTTELQYPVAKLHQILHNAPQFRPVCRGRRKGGIERVYHSADKKKTVTIMLWRECDISDQSLLCAIVAMSLAEDRGKFYNAVEGDKAEGDSLYQKLEVSGSLGGLNKTIKLETTRYELLKEMNVNQNKQTYIWLMQSLKRLLGIQIRYEDKHKDAGFNLISYVHDKDSDKINIMLNPLSAAVILGSISHFTLLHREERTRLKSAVAKSLHSVLSGLCSFNKSRVIKMQVLSDRIYVTDSEKVKPGTQRKRFLKIKEAVKEVNRLPYWQVKVIGKGKSAAVKALRSKPENKKE